MLKDKHDRFTDFCPYIPNKNSLSNYPSYLLQETQVHSAVGNPSGPEVLTNSFTFFGVFDRGITADS